MNEQTAIIQTVLEHYPDTQAVYLFGSYITDERLPESDVDIALLLPPKEAKKAGSLMMNDLRFILESLLKINVDLVNLRQVSTVLQKEVINADCRIYSGNTYAAEEFEMLVMSQYQKLNEERAGIIEEALASGRFHQV
jgi:predicted nucleotidyltransferase